MEKVAFFDRSKIVHKTKPLLIVIDDDRHAINLLIRTFKDRYRIETLLHPVELFERSFSQRPKAIILDMNIAQVDGIKALQCLKNHPMTCEIPIISMTLDQTVGFSDLLLQEGSIGVLQKPLQLNALERELEGTFEKINSTVESEDKSNKCTLCFSQTELRTNVKNTLLKALDQEERLVFVGSMKGSSWNESKTIREAIHSGQLIYLELKPEALSLFREQNGVDEFFEDLKEFVGESHYEYTFLFENLISLIESYPSGHRVAIARLIYKLGITFFSKTEYFVTLTGNPQIDISNHHLANILVGRRAV